MTCTTTQSMQALAKANEVRTRNAAFRRHVSAMTSGDVAHYVADVFNTLACSDDSDQLSEVIDAPVEYVIRAVRGYGKDRANRLMRTSGLLRVVTRNTTQYHGTQLLRVQELTSNEAASLADSLRLAHPRATTYVLGDENHG